MRKCLLYLIFAFLSFTSLAQNKTITGKVISSEDNTAIPGVSVLIKGTIKGTSTDASGAYSLEAGPGENVLVFSFIGMLTQEIVIDNQTVIDVTMKPGAELLNEVVVVGYGTEQKILLTGSVGVLKSEAIKDLPVPSVDGVLQGQVAGVQVSQNSGTPGGGMSVRIRGISSIGANNQPLYVIDGIPVTTGDFAQVGYEGQGINALNDLNPNDIETMSVLKDAAASSIYGARASNGIVLITTKRGKVGKPVVSFNAYAGVQQVWKRLDMLNAKQWMDYRNDLVPGTYSQSDMDNIKTDTNWQDQIFRTGPIQNYELSVQGGTERSKYFVSGNYFDQEGTVIGSAYKRFNTRLNLDTKVSDRFNLGVSIGLTNSTTNRIEGDASLHGPLPNGISTPAVFPVYNPDGTYNQDGPYSNPVSIANGAINQNFTFRTLANVYGEYKILKGLTFTSKWGADFYNLREHAFEYNTVQGQKYNGLGFETYSNVLNLVSNNFLTYVKSFGKHNFEAMGGYSFESKTTRTSFIRAQDFADANLQYINSASTIVSASSSGLDTGLRSFFGRVNYNFADKYLFSVSGRSDASSFFSPQNHSGFFPAASAGWRISEEEFMKSVTPISQLKLRASYGLTGNNDIPPFKYDGQYGTGSYGGKPALIPSNPPSDLKWEATAQLDVGLDIGIIHDRVLLTVDYYDKETSGLLLDRPVPPSTGYTHYLSNIGELQNKGLEFSVQSQILTGELKWNTSLNLSFNRNKVLKLYNHVPIDNLGRGSNRVEEGQPLGIFYSYKSLGVNPSTGDIVFQDTDHNGQITTDDRTKIGDPNPTYTGGFTNNFAYKGFDLAIFLQFSYGNNIFNGSRLFLESLQRGDNQTTAVLRRWEKPGDITDIPRATTDPVAAADNVRVSSRFIEDGSYLRIKNVTLGYTFGRNQL
ncbi:MAG TPA: TonB-dependent receptor, partial [Cyclobacteriaceae bacterium]|nr:TonB-dependent receptor [Cyclobacteriaceae bacterium]